MTEPRRYRVELSREARKAVLALPEKHARQVRSKIDALETDPRPQDHKQLKGSRAKGSRGIYRIEDNKLVVLIVRIGKRNDDQLTLRRLNLANRIASPQLL